MRYLILPRCNGKTYMADNLYKAACEYMARTELYDRSLTKARTQHDPTEAFIDAYMRGLAVTFAQYVRSDVTKKYCITPFELGEEIGRHRSYSAQMWIDEYERLQGGK
jgi:hypothetical protein